MVQFSQGTLNRSETKNKLRWPWAGANAMSEEPRKSLYVFLTTLLGVLLFLVFHRLLSFFYFKLLEYDFSTFSLGLEPVTLLSLDRLTFTFALMLGAWYGIGLGLHWYEIVYEHRSYPGLTSHLLWRYWPKKESSAGHWQEAVRAVAEELEETASELEAVAGRDISVPKRRGGAKPPVRRRRKTP